LAVVVVGIIICLRYAVIWKSNIQLSQWKPVIQITYIILVKVKSAGGTNIFYHFFKRFGKHFALHQTRNDITRYKYPFLQLIFVYNQKKKRIWSFSYIFLTWWRMAISGHRCRSIRRLGSPEFPISLPFVELYTFSTNHMNKGAGSFIFNNAK